MTAHDPEPSAVGPVPAEAGRTALSGGVGGPAVLQPLLAEVLAALVAGARSRGGPLPAGAPAAVADAVRAALAREAGEGALAGLTELLAWGGADPADPSCAAHLHCPPLAVAVAADLAVSALNPSQDSWDQAPAATALETQLLAELAALVGYDPAEAAGVLTSGGTESNLMGLMLARDQRLGCRARAAEIGRPDLEREIRENLKWLAVLCRKAADQRGLGRDRDLVEVRLYDRPPTSSVYQIDDLVVIGFMPYGTRSSVTPHIGAGVGHGVANFAIGQFQQLWDSGDEQVRRLSVDALQDYL